MHKLWAAIKKDLRILIRDKAGIAVMFAMPIFLVVVISSIQNSTFKLVNDKKVPLLICNHDGGGSSIQLVEALQKIGMFDLMKADSSLTDKQLTDLMHSKDALIAVVIPSGFSSAMDKKAQHVTAKALNDMGISLKNEGPKNEQPVQATPVTMYYNPVLEQAFRFSVEGALHSAQQFIENRQMVQALYHALNGQKLPDSLEQEILQNQSAINEVPIAKDGSSITPNITQHNVPGWTIFAMFFIVVSLSTSVVKEKISGSFVRLKTLPTNYIVTLTAKQITYIGVTLAQVAVIFSLGIFLFPLIGLPKLSLPSNLSGLLFVSIVCGWCAVSYGILIGVYAKTLEQAIGFGATSVVILAAIGGIIVPAFAMPDTMKMLMKISPLHWCIEAYYTLFLGRGYWQDVLCSILPLLVIIVAMQLVAVLRLKTAFNLILLTMEKEQQKRQLKEHIIKYLNFLSITPDEIKDDESLFGEGLGLDSIDSIELVVMLEREYGIKIENPKDGRKILTTVNTMFDFIEQNKAKTEQP